MQIQTAQVLKGLFALPPLLLCPLLLLISFSSLVNPFSSVSNPSWCSHVCWSRARTESTSYAHGGATGMCQRMSVLTGVAISGLQGIFCVALGQGKLSFLFSLQDYSSGSWFSENPDLLPHSLTLLFEREEAWITLFSLTEFSKWSEKPYIYFFYFYFLNSCISSRKDSRGFGKMYARGQPETALRPLWECEMQILCYIQGFSCLRSFVVGCQNINTTRRHINSLYLELLVHPSFLSLAHTSCVSHT